MNSENHYFALSSQQDEFRWKLQLTDEYSDDIMSYSYEKTLPFRRPATFVTMFVRCPMFKEVISILLLTARYTWLVLNFIKAFSMAYRCQKLRLWSFMSSNLKVAIYLNKTNIENSFSTKANSFFLCIRTLATFNTNTKSNKYNHSFHNNNN